MQIWRLIPLLFSLGGPWISGVDAWPAALAPRQYASIALSILSFIDKNIGQGTWAWNYKALNDFCEVAFSTNAGGGCKMAVTCDDGKKEYNNFQVCEVHKQQHWHDPRIGDFSIEYSKAGGINDGHDGLLGPLLRFKNINKWEVFDVDDVAISIDYNDYTAKDGKSYVCWLNYHVNVSGQDSKKLDWGCGIPKLGRGLHIDGIDMDNTIPDKPGRDYAVGKCSIHLVQHQKPNPSKDEYKMEIWIKDANLGDIGAIYPAVEMKANVAKKVDSKLKVPLEVMMHKVDKDPVSFVYGKEKWDTNTPDRCKVGAYDSGMRQLDCDFPCK